MLAYFLINVLLAVLWMCMWGLFDIWTMLAGFFFGYLLLGAVSRTWYPDGKGYGSKLFNLISFGFYFIRILIQANLTVITVMAEEEKSDAEQMKEEKEETEKQEEHIEEDFN